jgi:hypothetical protein
MKLDVVERREYVRMVAEVVNRQNQEIESARRRASR